MYSTADSQVKHNFNIIEYKVRRSKRQREHRKPVLAAIIVVLVILVYVYIASFVSEPIGHSDSVVLQNKSEADTVNHKLFDGTEQNIPDALGHESEFQMKPLKLSEVQNSIFFIDASGTGDLSSRRACSIESAARANQDRYISIIYMEPIPSQHKFENLALTITREYRNVVFHSAPLSWFLNDTPFEGKDENTWPNHHQKANVIRYLSFYKFGGTFLELDMIVTRSFVSLPWDWVVKENSKALASGAMSVTNSEGGKLLSSAAVTELSAASQRLWKYRSHRVITRAMKKICTTRGVANMTAAGCNGIAVLESKYFYPITHWPDIFEPGDISEEPYAYHFWNDLSKSTPILRNTLFDKLASKFCPIVYSYYLRNCF